MTKMYKVGDKTYIKIENISATIRRKACERKKGPMAKSGKALDSYRG